MPEESKNGLNSSFSSIAVIAWFSFLEAFRNRLFLGIFLLTIPLSLSAWLIDPYHLGFQIRIVSDVGITLISTIGLLIIVFLSLDQIIPDIEKRTVYFIFTRTPKRYAYIFGKFIGVCISLACLHLFLGTLLTLILKLRTDAWFTEIPVAVFMIFLKQSLFISIIMLLSTCFTKIITMSLSILIYVIGHGLDILRSISEHGENYFLTFLINIVSLFFPDFSLYETRIMIMSELSAKTYAIALLIVYTVFAASFYLSIGSVILRKRDL